LEIYIQNCFGTLPITIGQKLTNYNHLAFNKATKESQTFCKHYTLQLPWKTQQFHDTLCFAKNNSMVACVLTKNKIVPLNHNLTCASYGISVGACVICHEQILCGMVIALQYLE